MHFSCSDVTSAGDGCGRTGIVYFPFVGWLVREFFFSQVALMIFMGDSFLVIAYRRVAGYVPVWWPRPHIWQCRYLSWGGVQCGCQGGEVQFDVCQCWVNRFFLGIELFLFQKKKSKHIILNYIHNLFNQVMGC